MDPAQMTETLKSSFLFAFRTGNIVVDTLLTGIIIMLSTHLLGLANSLTSWDFRSLVSWVRDKRLAKIVITGKKVQGEHNTRLEYSTNFFAVLHQIKKLDCVSSDIFQLSEVPIQEPSQGRYYTDYDGDGTGDTTKGVKSNLIVSQTQPFKLTDKVYGQVNIMQNQHGNEKNPQQTEEFQISICSHVLTAEGLRDLLHVWVKEYENHLNSDRHLKYFVYTPSSQSTEDYYDATSHYSEFRFESGKTFANIFYPEKDDILKRINFFSENKAWYKKRGIPYTMGFLLYGEPGCGKTSTIKAIANHTQRHIVSVPLNKIKSGKELLNVFYNVKMNCKDIPLNKRLYVLEDIDCADLKDIVKDRGETTNNKDGAAAEDMMISDDKDSDKDSGLDLLSLLKVPTVEGFKNKNKLTLATLLEVLDGVMEMEGRMLVITTNYPEKLDKALIRPGRIDMKIKFDRCTGSCLLDMYRHYFETDDLPPSFDPSHLPDYRWTPAEATQIFLNNMYDPPRVLEDLILLEPTVLFTGHGTDCPESDAAAGDAATVIRS